MLNLISLGVGPLG